MVLRLGFFSVVFLVCSCSANNDDGNSIRLEALSGNELFNNNCSACHGIEGDAGVGGASDLTTSKLEHFGIRDIIEKGGKTMPPQTHAYKTDEELDNLIEYVISLRKD